MFTKLIALVCSVVAISLALVLLAWPSPTDARPPAKAGAVIACFHPETRHYTAQAQPGQCHFRGYGKKGLVGIPVKGMKWGNWGSNPTRAAHGMNALSGRHLRIIAVQPIVCEGRAWYSRIVVVTLRNGNFFDVRLPTCDGHV